MTTILRIEHAVSDVERWRRAFEADPVGREARGVRRYRIMRATDEHKYVLIDLESDDASSAETMLSALHELWGRVDVIGDPRARIVELLDHQALVCSA